MALNKERERLQEVERLNREQKELKEHCTFKPQLVTTDYFKEHAFASQRQMMSTDEFNNDPANLPHRPIISIEKYAVMQG
jgi:hypothetical protein